MTNLPMVHSHRWYGYRQPAIPSRLGPWLLLFGIFVALSAGLASGTPLLCSDPLQPTFILQSSTQFTYLQGHTMTVYPSYIPAGSSSHQPAPFFEAMMSFSGVSFFEALPSYDAGVPYCPDLFSGAPTIVQTFTFAEAYCSMTNYNTTSENGVGLQVVNVTMTHPSFPGTSFWLVASLASETYWDTIPATANTSYTVYNFTHLATAPKLELYLNNWAWAQPPYDSFLGFYANLSMISPYNSEVQFNTSATTPYIYVTVDEKEVFLELVDVNAWRLDGIDYARPPAWSAPSSGFEVLANQPFSILLPASFCTPDTHEPYDWHYTQLFIDPSLVAIFTGPVSESPSGLAPGAIAAIVVVLVVLAAVAGVVVFYVKVYSKRYDRALATKSTRLPVGDAQQRGPTSSPSSRSISPAPSSSAPSSSWRQSSKPLV